MSARKLHCEIFSEKINAIIFGHHTRGPHVLPCGVCEVSSYALRPVMGRGHRGGSPHLGDTFC